MTSELRCVLTLMAAMVPLLAAAQNREDLHDLSLEELTRIEVTSVLRRAEPLGDAAASIYVVTADAIRRSGVTSLPEALRLAPTLQVARTGAGQYAISARGFNNAIGNKLLVLIDGRTVYTPFFSGVFWDQQDVMLEDVARIEVITGPGATLWGANAVNGVINVITREAAQTQGVLVSAGAGNQEQLAGVRYGGALGADGHFRVYAKARRTLHTDTAAGDSLPDAWTQRQLGFRSDWGGSGADRFTLQGDAYQDDSQSRSVLGPIRAEGANLLARWDRHADDGSSLRVQGYLDHTRRTDFLLYQPKVDLADLEFQQGLRLAGDHQFLWGGGYRRAHVIVRPSLFFGWDPDERTLGWLNVFAQDEYALAQDLTLVAGAKMERNDFTGWEFLPSLRLAWKLREHALLWAAASRAVRAPAPLDRDVRLPPTPPYIIAGGPDFRSEVADVAELGWRIQPGAGATFSATLFWQHWDGLRSGQTPPDALVQNMIAGQVHGLETWGEWQPLPFWRLSAGLTLLHKDLHLLPGSTDMVGPSNLGNDPAHQWRLESSVELPYRQELTLSLRRVAALPQPAVPAYTSLDLSYGWRVKPGLELSLTGTDLLDRAHPEWDAAPGRSEFKRALFMQLRWTP